MASESKVARVLSRGADAIVPFDVVLGDGHESKHHDALQALAEDVSNAPRTDAIERVAHVVVDLAQLLRYQTLGFDLQYQTLQNPMNTAVLQRAQDMAAAQVITTGGRGVQTVANEQGAMRDREARRQMGDAADVVVAKFSDRASKVANDLKVDAQAAKDAIELEIVEFDSLDSLGADVELTDLSKQVTAFDEVMSKGKSALPFLFTQVESAIRLKRDLKNLRAVAYKVSNLVLANPEKFFADRANHDRSGRWVRGPNERDDGDIADAIIKMLAQEKESRRPPTIATAMGLFSRAFDVFRALAGRSPNDVALMMYVDRPVLEQSWENTLDPDWIRRFLRPSGLELPGWSRVVIPSKTDAAGRMTAPVRAPAPKPRVAAPVKGMT